MIDKIIEEMLQSFIQLYISMWADYKEGALSEPYLTFLKTSASGTREYMKSSGQWKE